MNTTKQICLESAFKSTIKNVLKGAVIFLAVYVMMHGFNDVYIEIKQAIADAWLGR